MRTNIKIGSKIVVVSAAAVFLAALLSPTSSIAQNGKLLIQRALVSSAPVGLTPGQALNFSIACAGNQKRDLPCRVRTRILDSQGRVRKQFRTEVEIDKIVTFAIDYKELLPSLPPTDQPPPPAGEVMLRVESLVDTFLRVRPSGGKGEPEDEAGPQPYYTTRVVKGFGDVVYLCTPEDIVLYKRPVRGTDF